MAMKIPMWFTTGTIIQTTARTKVRINEYTGEMNIVTLEYISQVVPDKTIDIIAPVDKNILELLLGLYCTLPKVGFSLRNTMYNTNTIKIQ